MNTDTMSPSLPGTVREYRYERKYFTDQVDARQAIELIKHHPGHFREIYPPRHINNIYFDSPLMDNYLDNIDGAPRRVKARIRWYHDLFGRIDSPQLEFKIKEGLMGTKIQYPLKDFNFSTGFSPEKIEKMIGSSELPIDVEDYLKNHQPVLVNRYLRWYFATPDHKFRVTIDTEMTFYHLNRFSNQFLHHQTDHSAIVVELKYSQEHDPEAGRISSWFPFRMTRSSKYVQGIDWVF